jgi:hypothetical protein
MQLEEARQVLDLRRRAMKANKARRLRMAEAEAQRRLKVKTIGPYSAPAVAELTIQILEEWEHGDA